MEHSTPKPSWVDGLPPRTAMGIGATLGVGVVGVVGFLILLPNAIKGGKTIAPPTPVANVAAVPSPTPSAPPAPAAPVNIVLTETDVIRGNRNAKVTIVEWSDFQCPFCSRFHPTIQQALREYGDRVRWVYRHFPLDAIHPQARPAAEASECAREQGKFWEFADKLFERQPQLGPDLYTSLAKDLKLNEAKFKDCAASRKYQQKVNDDEQAGLAVGVRGTPGSFVNGVAIPGAVPYEDLKGAIEQALAK